MGLMWEGRGREWERERERRDVELGSGTACRLARGRRSKRERVPCGCVGRAVHSAPIISDIRALPACGDKAGVGGVGCAGWRVG